jgi:Cdc6-like AAA superfamily ATPase
VNNGEKPGRSTMSLDAVRRALESFSQEENHHAVVLKGDWGTGKTFLWNNIVKSKKEKFKTKNYSYISLFGLTTLKDVKQAIYENTVSRETADLPISYKETTSNLKNFFETLKRIGRKGSTHASNTAIPFTRPLDSLINSIQYSLTNNTLICIDDFERKSDKLSDKEVLGLISNLVELKDCRVILILNSNTIEKDRDYYAYHEKVFSYEIEYSPTPDELISLTFDHNDNLDKKLIETIQSLKISNIRLYKK